MNNYSYAGIEHNSSGNLVFISSGQQEVKDVSVATSAHRAMLENIKSTNAAGQLADFNATQAATAYFTLHLGTGEGKIQEFQLFKGTGSDSLEGWRMFTATFTESAGGGEPGLGLFVSTADPKLNGLMILNSTAPGKIQGSILHASTAAGIIDGLKVWNATGPSILQGWVLFTATFTPGGAVETDPAFALFRSTGQGQIREFQLFKASAQARLDGYNLWAATGAGTLQGWSLFTATFTASGGSLIGQVAGQVWLSVAMSNIGSSYKDIYSATAFGEEHLMWIDFTNVTDVRIVYIWDYVGAGTQQIRWADIGDNNNVLYESPTFTADRDPIDSGWFTKPAFATGLTRIEWQGKSTTTTDDPVAKGYVIYVR